MTSTLYRWYSLSKRICRFARQIGVTLDAYVSRIEEFWRRIDYENLKCQLQFEQDYVENHHSLSDLIHLFPELSLYANNFLSDPTLVPDWVSLALHSFNICDYADLPKLKDTHDFHSMFVLHNKIYRDSHKRMFTNAYRDGKLSVNDPQLSRIVRKYQKYKNLYE